LGGAIGKRPNAFWDEETENEDIFGGLFEHAVPLPHDL
jgi:hypothetical protein